MSISLELSISPDRAAMGRLAGAAAAEAISKTIDREGNARVILASAPSQSEMLDALLAAGVDWSRVTIFHMDEYVGLPASHPASFRAYQQAHVLSRIAPAAFHGIAGENPSSGEECARYAALLSEAPIHVVCLGIGENGHLAFNDPPVADFADPELVKVVELDLACRQQQVNDGCFATLDDVPKTAITLTIPALMSGEVLVCTVPGPRKADAIQKTLEGPIATSCPASILRNHPCVRLFIDEAAATGLSRR